MYSGMSSETEDTWHLRGHSWASDWSQHPNTGLWLAGCYHCNMQHAMCCQNMSQLRSHLCLVFIWTKWLDLNQTGDVGCHNVWDSTFPAHSIIAPWDTICMRALSQFPYRHRVEAAPGAVLWLHLNAVISLYAAHYRRQVWSTLTLLPKSFRSFAHKLFCYI